MEMVQEMVSGIRNLKKEKQLQEDTPVSIAISCADDEAAEVYRAHEDLLSDLAGLEGMEVGVDIARPTPCATSVVGTSDVHMELEGVIDVDEEIERLQDEKEDVEDYLGVVRKKLDNPQFVENAPEDVVQKERDKEERLRGKLDKIEQNLRALT